MKWKALLCLAAVLSMLVTTIPTTNAASTTLAIIFEDTSTPELVGPPPYPCDSFTVWLKVFDISNLWFWACEITWDPTIVTCLEVREGNFLKDVGSTLFPTPVIDNDLGEIRDMCCGLMVEAGATGTGVLAEIDFHVEGFTAVAGMNISILDLDFCDPAEVPIPIDVVTPGWLQLLPPGPTPPNAEFVPVTCTFIYVGDTVNLNAEASEPGWDSLPTPDGNTCPIQTYTWHIDVGNNGTDPHDFDLEGVAQSFLCEYLGDVGINLTVYAPDPEPPTDERYDPYDWELHVIHQITKPVGPGGKIDLFTQKEPYSGRGPNVPSDAFGPEKEVKLTANLTYNDDPVSGKLVRITVIDPDNGTLLHRTSTTNGDGLATVDFRIPPNATFGTYFAIAIAEVPDPYNPYDSEKTINDTLTFKVGWIVEIVSIKTVKENHMEQEKFTRESHVGIQLVLRNIAMTKKKVTVAVSIYDCSNTPLNSTEEDFEAQPGNNTLPALFLYIPKRACVSLEREAVAHACVSLGGVPYCPEVSKLFFITNHDIAVLSVQPSPTVVYRGETVNISVIVKNNGLEIESFNVSVCYNEAIIGMSPVFDLQPGLNKKVDFTWNTSCVEEGLYRISAYVEPVPGEIDTFDNVLAYDFVEVRATLFLLAAALSFLLVIFICVVAIVLVLLRTLEKKKKGQPTSSEVKNCKVVGFKRSKTCSACGKEFSGAYTFCPHCFTFHGKDYE